MMVVGSAIKFDDERVVAYANGTSKADFATQQQQATTTAARLGVDAGETLTIFRQLRKDGLDPLGGSFDYIAARANKTGEDINKVAELMKNALTGDEDARKELGLEGNKAFMRAAARKDKRGIDQALGDQWKKDDLGPAATARAATVTGQIAQMTTQWERFKAAVADAGVYNTVIEKIKEVNSWIDAKSTDGSFKNGQETPAPGLRRTSPDWTAS